VGHKLGYQVDVVIQQICTQSPEIAEGIGVVTDEKLGAGDQGIMFGYACNDNDALLPYGLNMANEIIRLIEEDVQRGDVLMGDAKCQVTVDIDAPRDERSFVEILISVCHKPGMSRAAIEGYICNCSMMPD
jgi:S-adenosylmethionine synthetase